MTRSSFPTSPDGRFDEDVQLQRLWIEFGPGAHYCLGEPEGDCSIIEIEVSKDLETGVPYNSDLRFSVALVRDGIESQGRIVDTLLDISVEDPSRDLNERITLPDCTVAMAREAASSASKPDRLELNCVNIRVHPQNPNLRVMLVYPAVDPNVLEGDRWLLELRLGSHDLVRRLSEERPTLIPPQP